jgi:hypothetical protein
MVEPRRVLTAHKHAPGVGPLLISRRSSDGFQVFECTEGQKMSGSTIDLPPPNARLSTNKVHNHNLDAIVGWPGDGFCHNSIA